VLSSYGHIRDLRSNDMSIDLKHNFSPIYEIPEDKVAVVARLRKASSTADIVWLASDEDREGEAISWHLKETLGLPDKKTKRIVFHEITKPAILEAVKHPRTIDLNLVDAQQARRVLDRIVGYELSPVLWKKIKPGLSAGRVQSVAVRLIAEREKEIKAFQSETYYRVGATFTPVGVDTPLTAEFSRRLDTREEAMALLEQLKEASFKVSNITVKPVRRSPAPPFTTSTLQQEAARKLGFSVSQTMHIAQKLYEAGYITYMRTDSLNLSNLAIAAISSEVSDTLGSEYLRVRKFRTSSKGAQEAHEAIRPTYIKNHEIEGTLPEKKLYSLIWKRTIASQMADAELEKTTAEITISGSKDHFVAEGEVVKFDGFLKVYFESSDDDNAAPADMKTLPPLKETEELTAQSIAATQRFTQQPVRYTEASLVRKLEELGIGRPSTYAPTISTIQARDYVTKGTGKGEKREYEILTLKKGKITTAQKSEMAGGDKGRLLPTDVGMVVNDFLVEYFPEIVDYNFTAKVETDFDHIAAGKEEWNRDIATFYEHFHPQIDRVSKLRMEHKVGERILGNDPKTGKPISVKIGRYGPLVQMGSTDDDEKPRFASLQKGQSVSTLTLEEALKLFELPRTLGEYEGKEVGVATGRFGPYVRHDGKYVSLPKDMSPFSVTLEEAIELIENKRQADAKRVLQTFAEEPELQVLNGRFGAYISYKKQSYRIPKQYKDKTLTLEQCREIIADEGNASRSRGRRSAATKKPKARR